MKQLTLCLRFLWGFALALAGCGGTIQEPSLENRCSTPGEFGWRECAIVEGIARDANGSPLSRRAIRADSLILGQGIQYTSKTVVTTDDGKFRLEIHRYVELAEPNAPATIELKLFQGNSPAAFSDPIAVAPVSMSFARIGELVDLTIVDVRFQPVPR